MAVTTQVSLDGIEKAGLQASMSWGQAAVQADGPVGGAENDRNKKANEIVRAIVGQITKE